MKKIFISGSSTGLGFLAAKKLISQGHDIYLHARNEKRAKDISKSLSGYKKIILGDLSNLEDLKNISKEVNELGKLDAIIHNAGISYVKDRFLNELNITKTFCVNVFAPYYLTENIKTPNRLIYLSSDLHYQGHFDIDNLQFEKTSWSPSQAYNDSKLLLTILMKYFSQKYPDCFVNAVDPGWVPTRMGGKNASDDLDKGYETQLWLSSSDSEDALVTGKYFHHKKQLNPHPDVYNEKSMHLLINLLSRISQGL